MAEPFDTENSDNKELFISHTKPLSVLVNNEMLERVISAAS